MYTYIGTYTYIYIYTLAESRYALSYTLVTQTMLALPPTGVPFTFIFSFFFKNPKTKLKSFRISRPSRNMLQNDGDFTRTEKGSPFFFNWRIGESVLGQAAVLSPISRSSPRTLPIACQQIGPFTAPRSRRSLSSSRLGESAKLEREGTLANHDFI